ncbi:acyltransferase domain-containing protein [Ralstonia syzygii]|uniref:acyltransferase domain-containing protein n=1 Tax=Ralstonia syzygii TaxID=28097 RepID=UPI0036F2DD7A
MLSVPLGEQALRPLLTAGLSLAAVNAPALCVVSGDTERVEALRLALQARGIEGRRLHVSHAFHSHMLEDAARAFETLCAGVPLSAPTQRYVSNVTGQWITPEQATSPRYWADHLRQAVRFSDGLQTLLADRPEILLEVGPGQSLTALARQHRDSLQGAAVVPTARHPLTEVSDVEHLVGAVGAMWGQGAAIDWQAFHAEEIRPAAAAADLCVPAPALLPAAGLPGCGQRVAVDPGPCAARRVGQADRSAL